VVNQKGIPNEECSDVQNFLFSPGLMKTRSGYFKYNTTALTGAITGIYDYKKRTGRFGIFAEDQYIIKESILYPNFVAWPQSGAASLTVYFLDITVDDSSEITSWLWDFGDSSTSTDQHPTHTYTATGLYTVTMTVFCGTKSFIKTRTNYIAVGNTYNNDSPSGGGDSGSGGSNNSSFPYPTVTSITPSSVVEGYSATAVTIGGTNFRQDPLAGLIGTTKTTGLGFSSSTALTGTVPAGKLGGIYDVIVSNPDGVTGGLVGGFIINLNISTIYHSEVSDYIYILADTGSGIQLVKLSASVYPNFLMIEENGSGFSFLNTSKTDGSHTQIYPGTVSTITVEDEACSLAQYEFVIMGDNAYVSYATASGRVNKYSLSTGALLGTVSGFGFSGDTNGLICTDGTNLFCIASDYVSEDDEVTTTRLIKINPTTLATTTYDRADTDLANYHLRIQADANNVYSYHDVMTTWPTDKSFISKLTKSNVFVSRFEVDFAESAGDRGQSEFRTDGTNHYFWLHGTTAVKKYTTAGALVSTFTFNTNNPTNGGMAVKR
jgi:PKD repeat protein